MAENPKGKSGHLFNLSDMLAELGVDKEDIATLESSSPAFVAASSAVAADSLKNAAALLTRDAIAQNEKLADTLKAQIEDNSYPDRAPKP